MASSRQRKALESAFGISSDDPVTPEAPKRTGLTLRPTVSAGTGPSVVTQETLSSKQTSLGQLASSLAGISGFMGQIRAFESEKAKAKDAGEEITNKIAIQRLQKQQVDERVKQLGIQMDEQNMRMAEINEQVFLGSMPEEKRKEYLSQRQYAQQQQTEEARRDMNDKAGNAVEGAAQLKEAEKHPEVKRIMAEDFRGAQLGKRFQQHFVDALKEYRENVRGVAGLEPQSDESWEAFVNNTVLEYKEANEIDAGSLAEQRFHLALEPWKDTLLAFKREHFEIHEADKFHRDAHNALGIGDDILKASSPDLPAPLEGDPDPEVAAKDRAIQSLYWRETKGKTLPKFEAHYTGLVKISISEQSYEALNRARALLDLPDHDEEFVYRNKKFGESNLYRTLIADLEEAELRLNSKEEAKSKMLVTGMTQRAIADSHRYVAMTPQSDTNALIGNFSDMINKNDYSSIIDITGGKETDWAKEFNSLDANKKVEVAQGFIEQLAKINSTEGQRIAKMRSSLVASIAVSYPAIASQGGQGMKTLIDAAMREGGEQLSELAKVGLGIIEGNEEDANISPQAAEYALTLKPWDYDQILSGIVEKSADSIRRADGNLIEETIKNVNEDFAELGEEYTPAQWQDEFTKRIRESMQELHKEAFLNEFIKNANAYASESAAVNAEKANQEKKLDEMLKEEKESEERTPGSLPVRIGSRDMVTTARAEQENRDKALAAVGEDPVAYALTKERGEREAEKRAGTFYEAWNKQEQRSAALYEKREAAVVAYLAGEFGSNPRGVSSKGQQRKLRENMSKRATLVENAYKDKMAFGSNAVDLVRLLNSTVAAPRGSGGELLMIKSSEDYANSSIDPIAIRGSGGGRREQTAHFNYWYKESTDRYSNWNESRQSYQGGRAAEKPNTPWSFTSSFSDTFVRAEEIASIRPVWRDIPFVDKKPVSDPQKLAEAIGISLSDLSRATEAYGFDEGTPKENVKAFIEWQYEHPFNEARRILGK